MNLASFVNTWIPDECNRLMEENLTKVCRVSAAPARWIDR